MNLSNLKPAEGSVHRDRRLGRGEGSGKGGTATRGHKGQKSRSGYKRTFGFEGGQMPLQRRVPKHGFKNLSRREYKAINLSVLEELAEKKNLSKVDPQTLIDAGLVSGKDLVKILGNGRLTRKLQVSAHAFSESAKKAIEALDGSIEKI
jgi:large subunit ribosomal protein L15